MRRIILGLGMLAAMFSCASAGEIEIGGKWRQFDELLFSGGPVRTYVRESGLVATTGRTDILLEENEARILLLTGKRWSNYRFTHFEKRFWPLASPKLVLSDGDMYSYPVLEHELVPPYEREDAWYAFDIRFYNVRVEKTMEKFRTIVDIANVERDDFKFKHCIEMRGKITWSSSSSLGEPGKKKRLYRYVLIVDSVREAGLIPSGHLADQPPVPNLEDATKLCSPEK